MQRKIKDFQEYGIWFISLFGHFSNLYTKVANCNIFTTTRCNSKCKMCRAWQLENLDISLKAIENIIKSKCITKYTDIGLEGGEFLFHPELEQIMEILDGYRVSAISNGIMTEQLLDFIVKYNIYKVAISLDGTEEYQNTYRMKDSYEKVIKTLESLSKYKTKKIISVIYTPTPWNTDLDYHHVKCVAEKLGINFGLGMYIDHEIFKDGYGPEDLSYKKEDYPYDVSCSDFGRLLPEWLDGKINIPCLTKKIRVAIWPNGNLPLCFSAGLIIGNLNNNTLDEIFSKNQVSRLMDEYANCNKCWLAFHRSIDVEFFCKLQRVIPINTLRLFWKDLQIN